jgi:hypothetical protein
VPTRCTYWAGRDEVEAIPSIGDMESWEVADLICGIANVVEGPDGTKKCGDIASCGPPTKPRRDCEASRTAHPMMDRHPVLEHQLLMHRHPVCRGGTAIDGYVNLLHAAEVLKIGR